MANGRRRDNILESCLCVSLYTDDERRMLRDSFAFFISSSLAAARAAAVKP